MYKDLVEYLAKALVDNPDEVEVSEREEENSVQLELSVNQKDLGKVIGRQGKTARAMRTILGAAAAKEGRRASLEIVE
ncbi:MAG: KH domain-containing protein [Deltaproteobacteria bacterium]|nr:KH domain-containing protein [Deltaproteobacteria bacterium]